MVNVQSRIHIDRPRTEVADFAANPDNAPQWYVNIHSSQRLTAGPLGVGSKVAFNAAFMGRELSYTYEFVEYVPGGKLVMRTAQGPFPMETTHTWQPVDGTRTRMTLRNRGEPAGFGKVAAPVMAAAMRRANQKDLANLKRILDN